MTTMFRAIACTPKSTDNADTTTTNNTNKHQSGVSTAML